MNIFVSNKKRGNAVVRRLDANSSFICSDENFTLLYKMQ